MSVPCSTQIIFREIKRYWIFKSSIAFYPYIVEKSVNTKSFLKFNLQAHRVIFRAPCTAVFLRFALFQQWYLCSKKQILQKFSAASASKVIFINILLLFTSCGKLCRQFFIQLCFRIFTSLGLNQLKQNRTEWKIDKTVISLNWKSSFIINPAQSDKTFYYKLISYKFCIFKLFSLVNTLKVYYCRKLFKFPDSEQAHVKSIKEKQIAEKSLII